MIAEFDLDGFGFSNPCFWGDLCSSFYWFVFKKLLSISYLFIFLNYKSTRKKEKKQKMSNRFNSITNLNEWNGLVSMLYWWNDWSLNGRMLHVPGRCSGGTSNLIGGRMVTTKMLRWSQFHVGGMNYSPPRLDWVIKLILYYFIFFKRVKWRKIPPSLG